MQLIRLANLNKTTPKQKTIATIGNFDGVHLGHHYLLTNLVKKAKSQKLSTTVICFEPQPKEFFTPENTPVRITPFRDKIEAFKKYNIDQILCLKFNTSFAELSAEEFIEKILITGLNISHIVIGDDFRFGYKRKGDYNLLKQHGLLHNYTTSSTSSFIIQNKRVSSSQIRAMLKAGDFDQATKLLGRSYTLSGRVHHGNQNGRKIGFPTINIPMPTKVAVAGVYIVKVHFNSLSYYGVANIGVRPTINGVTRLLETYIFDLDEDLYGTYVSIEFLKFIRSEAKFANFDELKTQINADKNTALQWLKDNNKETGRQQETQGQKS